MKKLRNDLLLIGGLLILVAGLFTGWYFISRGKGKTARIYYEDELVAEVDLYKKQRLQVQGKISTLTIEVSYGEISVLESGCPNQICVHTGRVSHEHESITCLPNHITIVVVEGDSHE